MAGYRKRWGRGHLLLGCSRVTAWLRWCLVLKQHFSLTALIAPRCRGHKGMWVQRNRRLLSSQYALSVAPYEPDMTRVLTVPANVMFPKLPRYFAPLPPKRSSVPRVWALASNTPAACTGNSSSAASRNSHQFPQWHTNSRELCVLLPLKQ